MQHMVGDASVCSHWLGILVRSDLIWDHFRISEDQTQSRAVNNCIDTIHLRIILILELSQIGLPKSGLTLSSAGLF